MTDATEFEIRGELAAALKCWHRLTGDEAQELVAFVAALRAEPAEPFKKLSDDQILWIAESHGIDTYASNPLAFYIDLISTTPTQPDQIVDASEMVDHSELVNRLRSFDFGANDTDEWIAIMDEAADALEGKTK